MRGFRRKHTPDDQQLLESLVDLPITPPSTAFEARPRPLSQPILALDQALDRAAPRRQPVQSEARRAPLEQDSWQEARRMELAAAAWFGIQWLGNGAFTVLGIYPALRSLVTAVVGALGRAEQAPGWAITAEVVLLGVVIHLIVSYIERRLWTPLPIAGHVLRRLWHRIGYLWHLPRATRLLVLLAVGVDVGTSFLGMRELLAGARLIDGLPALPQGGPLFLGVIALLAVWIAVTSESGMKEHWRRARRIKEAGPRYWQALYGGQAA